jgi:cytochrome c oxidase cbb3-type subunit 3
MSSFWSLWIIVLTIVTLIGIVWILFANRKSKNTGPDATTGHEYDGIEEYDNPLPAWWFYMFVVTIIFSIGYLIAYPGMGNFKGVLNWTQVNQWQAEIDKAEKKYGAIFAEYSAMPVEEVAQNPKALKMARRMFANNCSQCHGSDARGSYGFPNLTDEEWLYGGDPAQIRASITQGRTGAMLAWGPILGEQGVLDVSNYVLSLSGREVDETSAAAGQEKFTMMCVSCHGVEGKGNVLFGAPDLTNNIWLYGGSPGLIQRTINGGRNGVMPAHKDVLSEEKIHLLTAFVYSLSNKDSVQ